MSIIKIAGKKFKLASRWSRLGAFLLDTKLVEFVEAETETDGNAITETADLEKILGDVIREITSRFSEARQKVDASIGVEKQFQDAYEGAIVQAELKAKLQ